MTQEYQLETILAHAGINSDEATGALASPIHFSTTYQHPEFGNIGFSSWGDPGANEEPLDEILQMNCDFVITACRSKGQTIEVVENFLFISLKHFRPVWLK